MAELNHHCAIPVGILIFIYRDGVQIKDVVEEMNSWLDTEVPPSEIHTYTLKAYDAAGNLSQSSEALVIKAAL